MNDVRHRHVTVGDSRLHVAESGDPGGRPVLLLHGWPQSWRAWAPLMELAGPGVRTIALDLPGVGGSTGDATDGTKRALAGVVHGLVTELGLRDVTLVGHDIGAMVAHACVREHADDLARAVLVDAAVPGIPPWDRVVANPHIWHFAFHALERLPEDLVSGRERRYFDYFFDAVSGDPSRITPEARADYAAAYARPEALTAGFGWYRAFAADAAHNAGYTAARDTVRTPLLYLHSGYAGSDAGVYAAALAGTGCSDVRHDTLSGHGHFLPEEAPARLWERIARFLG